MNLFSTLLNVCEAFFLLALVANLFRGQARKHAAFTAYAVISLVAYFVENIAYFTLGWRSTGYYAIYWTDRIVLALLLLAVIIAYSYRALPDSPFRPMASKAMPVIAAVALILPLTFLPNHHGKAHGSFDNQWFNHTSQILNFGAAILNLVLWTALLTNRKRDPQVVTLSIGVGLITASGAIAWGAREWLSQGNRWWVDDFMLIANLAAVILWCSLFRPKAQASRKAVPPPAPPSAPPDALTTPS